MVQYSWKNIEFSVYYKFPARFRLNIIDSLSRHCALVIGTRWASKR